MIYCPECGDILQVKAERIFTQSLIFNNKKKGKGIKKQNISLTKDLCEEDIRIYFECDICKYATDNINSSTLTIERDLPELLKYKGEIDLIINQIYNMC